jgi:radical SAM superfamily enzyme YgiQ (UPF0313 family)
MGTNHNAQKEQAMSPAVYLADLRYNYSGFLANDCMPLGVGYLQAVMQRDLPGVRSRLFAYPDRLWDAMKDSPPDVLMLSNYVWNEALSFAFAKLAKSLNPKMLVVMGGPNISQEPERQVEYFRGHPEIDVYILGEGDFLATEVVQHFIDSGLSISRFGHRDIPSAIYRRDGEPFRLETWPRKKEIDEIPSPWLSGAMDEFFDGKLAPLVETNRGCPFTCTFCVQGTSWYTKVHNFSKERVREEFEYIAKRIHDTCPSMGTLRIADSNYGMFERDIELSGYLGEMQKKYRWPTYIDATTGKNRADRIIRSVEKVSGALVLYQAVQSLDENVLKNIKRSTIKLDAYEQILVHVRGRGMRSNSDLILCLPGETLGSHVESIHKLLDAGTSQVTNFQLMMLKGSELETVATRQQFKFETRYRVLPKNFGIYGGEKVFDVEEIVVSTDTMTFDDYVEARKYALVSVGFWHNNDLDDALDFALKLGVKRSEWLDRTLAALENSTGAPREYLDNFVRQTKAELFSTRQECIAFYSDEQNFQRLLAGEVGENLMHKHNAIASFLIWPHICKIGMDVTRQLLEERGADARIPDFAEFWSDFDRFIHLRHAWGSTVEQILSPAWATLRYDMARWLADGAPVDARPYRLSEPVECEFRLSEEKSRALEGALKVWTTDIKGLTKLVTRIQVAWQVRDCRPASGATIPLSVLEAGSRSFAAGAGD